MRSSRQKDLSKVAPEPTGVYVPVGPGLRCWGPGHVGTLLAPGPVAFEPLVSGLVGGSQVQTEAHVAPQEEAQHHDEAHQEDDPWEGQEQVLDKKDSVNSLQVAEVIDVSLQVHVWHCHQPDQEQGAHHGRGGGQGRQRREVAEEVPVFQAPMQLFTHTQGRSNRRTHRLHALQCLDGAGFLKSQVGRLTFFGNTTSSNS